MSSVLERKVEIGERYLVTWRDGQKHAGDIIERRLLKKATVTTSSSSSASSTDDLNNLSIYKPCDYEYYFHFPNFDRRLDEWVTIDRIDLFKLVVAEIDDIHSQKTVKKNTKRKFDENEIKKDEMLCSLEKEHDEITKVKNIKTIILGKYEIETWYFSPYPEDYCGEDKLYICECCLKYMKRKKTMQRHLEKCFMKSPPGKFLP
jgi:hypothetical protein